jgi:hypothetical protein
MSEHETGRWIPENDQVAVELRLAVRGGDVEAIRRLLSLPAARTGSPIRKLRLIGAKQTRFHERSSMIDG